MVEVHIEENFIKLGQFLKKIDIISSGGEAKYFLAENDVYVNGNLTKERGKKLFIGDLVKIFSTDYRIV